MHNIIIAQSGGPTSVINGSLYGIIKAARKSNQCDKIFGSRFGINGIIKEDFIDFKDLDIELLKNTPSAYLGSARTKLSDDFQDELYQKVLYTFKKHQITDLFFIGGNDSMDSCMKLDKFFKSINYPVNVIGVPKTIDNDLCFMDHTPGYASAAKFIIKSLIDIYYDTHVYDVGRVTIVEAMGRDAGWLAAAPKLLELVGIKVDLIYLPEVKFNQDKFIQDVERIYKQNKKVLVVISEGLRDLNDNYVLNSRLFNTSDDFGNLQLGGLSFYLAEIINKNLNVPVRAIELNLLQRCFMDEASLTDLKEAIKCGEKALKLAFNGNSGFMVTMERISNDPYKIKYGKIKLNKVSSKIKYFPKEWIINDNQISDEFITYLKPLIQGDIKIKKENSLPIYQK